MTKDQTKNPKQKDTSTALQSNKPTFYSCNTVAVDLTKVHSRKLGSS